MAGDVKISLLDWRGDIQPTGLNGGAVGSECEQFHPSAYREDSATTGINVNEADNTASNAGAVYIYF